MAPMFNLSNKSILVVDDSSIMRMFLVMNLGLTCPKTKLTEAVE